MFLSFSFCLRLLPVLLSCCLSPSSASKQNFVTTLLNQFKPYLEIKSRKQKNLAESISFNY